MVDGRSPRVLGYGMLDRDHLTRHLLELAQRVGVEKVTMRGLAVEAGTSASSVYYHVAGKDELLELLIEAVVNSIDVPTRGDWEARLVELYVNAWRGLVSVRGVAALLQQRPHTAAAANMDRSTRSILGEAGLPTREFEAAYVLLYVHLLGSVALEHNLAEQVQPGTTRAEAVFRDGLRIILKGVRHD
jgi:TetR/AcrR family transcriptional regulator, tetracycline repressor protein